MFIDVYRRQYLEKLYQYWGITQAWDHCKVKYVFRDERCNPPDHQYSNYGMAMSALFPTGIPEGCAEIRMQGELNREEAVRNYEQTPSRVYGYFTSVSRYRWTYGLIVFSK